MAAVATRDERGYRRPVAAGNYAHGGHRGAPRPGGLSVMGWMSVS
jgi:hypothetical protein